MWRRCKAPPYYCDEDQALLRSGNADLLLNSSYTAREIGNVDFISDFIKAKINVIKSSLYFDKPSLNAVKPLVHRIKPFFRDPGKRIDCGINAITNTFFDTSDYPCFQTLTKSVQVANRYLGLHLIAQAFLKTR